MQISLFQKLDFWAERLVCFPGCDQKTLNQRKTMWIGTVFGILHVVFHTGVFLIFFPEALKILIFYGYTLLIILGIGLFFLPKLIRGFELYCAGHLSVLLLLTFYIILKMGGIASSAGLIFACLAFVLSSVPLQNTRILIFLFSLYSVIVILSGVLVPWLTIPKEITPRINAIVFIMNTLSMSLLIFYLTFTFFSQQSQIEHLEADKLKEVNEAKTRLFTNITHEFRTPLTIIQGMNNLIRTNPGEWAEKGTVKIESQTLNLLTLVNHMLDLSKLESGSMPVHRIHSDIVGYLKYLTDSFVSMAREKDIRVVFSSERMHFKMDFDQEKIMFIVSNLLTNALKFTPAHGIVELFAGIEKDEQEFRIQVSDNGPGIPPEHLPFIFDRFFRIEEDHTTQEGGSGLGLALVKELVKLLGGSVSVTSMVHSGTTFTVLLPVSNLAPEKEIIPIESGFQVIFNPESGQESASENLGLNSDLPVLLVVEDSQDLKLYLKALLEKQYQLEFASNGKSGLEMAIEHIPDIVVSDVMMPVMDGITMLDILKHDFRTSHIPVIMLTAKADIGSRLTGLDKGADEYLSKPFNENELLIRLRKLIELRQVLHERYAAAGTVVLAENQPENLEDSFMQKIRSVMEANLSDDTFDAHKLSLAMSMSRSQLYRKFKSLTNQSVVDYFWTLRLCKARNLLQTTALNVSEVAWEVGFKNLSHFSRAFKNEFGLNPSSVEKNTSQF
ncbi:MAG: ATP-binding protein [Prolixibacteraceae bacterium]